MGLNQQELEEHCLQILQLRRIANKIVILCEGSIQSLKGRRSPSAYSQMEQMPDANFYKACVPKVWTNHLPVFFNCGDRNDVINTYTLLQEIHNEDPKNSYLNPDRLFAFIDLDLQIKDNADYKFIDTEKIYCHLYEKFELKDNVIPEHRILTTGLIYKEAYFLLPELQDIFDFDLNSPTYNGVPLKLSFLYKNILQNLDQDKNLQENLFIAEKRLDFCSDLNFENIESLKFSFEKILNNDSVAYFLFSITQVKEYWNAIVPEDEFTGKLQTWRDQLILKIGRFYATSTNQKHHIPAILRTIYDYYYGA